MVRIIRDWSEFRSTGTNSDRLVRIPNNWSEFRTIVPNDWSEFRTIGPNSERLVRIPNKFRTNDKFDVGVFKNQNLLNCSAAPMWRFLCAKQFENVQVLMAEKKSAWTDLDQVDIEKKSSMFKCPNRKIGVERSRQSEKGLFSGKCF